MLKKNEIKIDIGTVTLPSGSIPVASDWLISETIDFKDDDIIDQSLQDTENIFAKVFVTDLEPGKTYWHMVRLAYKYTIDGKEYTGFVTSDKIPFIAKDGIEENKYLDTPSVITIPKLSTSFRKNDHPSVGFVIKGTPYTAIDLLPDVYTIKAFYIGTNNDVSQQGSLTIRIREKRDVNIKGIRYYVSDKYDLENEIISDFDYETIQNKIYKNDELILEEEEVNNSEFTINKELLEGGKRYLLETMFFRDDKLIYTHYTLFYVLLNEIDYLPGNLPYPLGGSIV